ncbi:MAG: hypothetical protein E7632_08560 [Ruminococcaceae bacterium]|nr:hypothetical protein [Oscillospiraceae bacterium]
MTVNELAEKLELSAICGSLDKTFDGAYAGDLLSRCMSRVEADCLWITIMANVNVIAVATLTEPAAIILAENVEASEEVIEAANENGITLLSSALGAYELCWRIHELVGQ